MSKFKPFPTEISLKSTILESKFSDQQPIAIKDSVLSEIKDCVSNLYLDQVSRENASRDWWPISLKWALDGMVPQLPYAVAVVKTKEEICEVLKICNKHMVPVTPIAGRSGVCGGCVPIKGGLALDLSEFSGLNDIDETSQLANFNAGTFGPDIDKTLQPHNLIFGHYPQSIELSTLGGWLACRSAGQFSNRYGKVDQMVVNMEVVLASGESVFLGTYGAPASHGPNLMEIFLGSEGTLGVITSATLKLDKKPTYIKKRAFGFNSFNQGLEAIKLTIQDHAKIAVMRLYDNAESLRHFNVDSNVLITLDQGNPEIVNAAFKVLESNAKEAEPLDEKLVDRWLETRNDVSALGELIKKGLIVDTAEVSGPWKKLPYLYQSVIKSLKNIDGIIYASAHASHSYKEGGCLYFTFAGFKEGIGWQDELYATIWDAIMTEVLSSKCQISHHHGIGLLKAKYFQTYLGQGFTILKGLKQTLDPNNILNPGKQGL